MAYTIKGKIKRFLELTFIGKNTMAQSIIEEILNAQDGEFSAKIWSHKNISYSLSIDNDRYGTRYYMMRKNKTAFTFTFSGTFVVDIINTESLYRTWKELV